MNEKSLEEILESLAWIGLNKRLMSLGMAGWVNCLGLHVQLKEDGQRVLAGGMWRSYIDAVTSPDGEWQVRKFDKATWAKRFARILEPTLQISVFLMECADERGLHGESERVYWETIRHYRSTGEWLGLTATQEMRAASMSRREHERLQKWAAAHERVSSLIPELESQAAENSSARIQPGGTQSRLHELYVELLNLGVTSTLSPSKAGNSLDWVLRDLYEKFRSLSMTLRRHKDYEEATRRLIDAPWADASGESEPHQRFLLGMFYAAALSNQLGRVGTLWPLPAQSDLTPKCLGYGIEQVQDLSLMNLGQSREFYRAQRVENIRGVMEECRDELSVRGYPWYQRVVGILEASDEELLVREILPSDEFRTAMEEFYPGFSETHGRVEEIDLTLRAVNTMDRADFDAIDRLRVRRDEEEDRALGIDEEIRAGFQRLRDLERSQGLADTSRTRFDG